MNAARNAPLPAAAGSPARAGLPGLARAANAMVAKAAVVAGVAIAAAVLLAPGAPPSAAAAAPGTAARISAVSPPAMPGDPRSGAAHDSLSGAGRDSGAAAVAPAPARAPARDYLAEARAGYTAENRAYNHTRVALRIFGPLYMLIVMLVLLFTGISRRFRDIAHGLGHSRYVRVLVYFALFEAAVWLIGLPLEWFSDFALEHQYGMSNQTLAGWLGDSFKETVFDVVVLGVLPLLALVWAAVERWPRGWWWRIALGTVPVAMVGMLLAPVAFDPLFNHFTPLGDTALRTRILELAARADIPARKVYEVDMSRRTNKINAYVSGFGASQRIVLWDTTLRTLETDEILVVMGHEMGHYALGHVWRFIVALGVGAFALFFLCQRLTGWLVRAFGKAWGVTSPADLTAFPAFALALGLVLTLAGPGIAFMGRQIEHEADVYGLEITHDNDAAARAFLKLARDNRSDPEPAGWVRVLFFDHPPLGERIRFALSYRPWEHGQPNREFHPRH